LCVSLGRRVLGLCRVPQTFRHLAGLFGAALAAGAVSTLLSAPFRTETGVLQNCWWFLATTLGILVCTPLLVYAAQILNPDRTRRLMVHRVPPRAMATVYAAFFALSWPVFALDALPLVPL